MKFNIPQWFHLNSSDWNSAIPFIILAMHQCSINLEKWMKTTYYEFLE